MTKMHFTRAAELVNNIRQGAWTHEPPAWVDGERYDGMPYSDIETADYTRAVQTAEAFIILFREYNPRFNEQKFLKACGLGDSNAR